MKDPTLPPVIKIEDPVVASAMGATLATKRTTAERLAPGVDPNALVVEPYANPFRTYPLEMDYLNFKKLFEEKNVACYIFNTGSFMDKKVTKEMTLGSLEQVVEGTASFKSFGKIEGFSYLPVEGMEPDFSDASYAEQVAARMNDRVEFIKSRDEAKGGYDKLPAEVLEAMSKVAEQAKN